MLVSTHNLGSVPEFCDRTVLLNRTVLAYGPTVEIFDDDWLYCCIRRHNPQDIESRDPRSDLSRRIEIVTVRRLQTRFCMICIQMGLPTDHSHVRLVEPLTHEAASGSGERILEVSAEGCSARKTLARHFGRRARDSASLTTCSARPPRGKWRVSVMAAFIRRFASGQATRCPVQLVALMVMAPWMMLLTAVMWRIHMHHGGRGTFCPRW